MPPLNLVGDFGGGALYLAFGLLAGVIHARASGQGQVIDCAMTDGAASLMAMFYGFKAAGVWSDGRRANLLDGGAHFYDTYQCADGGWISIGSIEPQFYALLLEKTGINDPDFKAQMDRDAWPSLREKLATVIAAKTRDEWCEIMDATDVCFAPVLDLDEAPKHPHNVARQTFVEVAGVIQPAPAPRFSATPGKIAGPPPAIGAHNREALGDWGFSAGEIDDLENSRRALDTGRAPFMLGSASEAQSSLRWSPSRSPVPRCGDDQSGEDPGGASSPTARRTSFSRLAPASSPARSRSWSSPSTLSTSSPASPAKWGASIRAMGSSAIRRSTAPAGARSSRAAQTTGSAPGTAWPRASTTISSCSSIGSYAPEPDGLHGTDAKANRDHALSIPERDSLSRSGQTHPALVEVCEPR